jgi:hypothetical protein
MSLALLYSHTMGEVFSIPSDLAAFSNPSQSYKAIVSDDTSAALLQESGTVMILQYSLGLKVEHYRSSKGSYRQSVGSLEPPNQCLW